VEHTVKLKVKYYDLVESWTRKWRKGNFNITHCVTILGRGTRNTNRSS